MQRFLLVCAAGGLGCGTRYLVNLFAAAKLPTTFPFATLFVNLIGSFAIALVLELALRSTSISDTARITITTGFIGGLTTYSTFNYESSGLVLNGQVGRGIANLTITVVGCFLMGLAGLALARRIT